MKLHLNLVLMNKINNFQAFSSCKAKYTALEVFGGMYIPKYNSAPGERSGHVRPDSVTFTETFASNPSPSLISGNDWLAMAPEWDLWSSMEDNESKLRAHLLLFRDL